MKRLILTVLGLALLAGCDSSPPCPTDQQLIEQFRANRAGFEDLLQGPESPDLLAAVKVERVIDRSNGGRRYWFQVWHRDLVGPGGYSKGLAYSDDPLTDLVDSIDANSAPGTPEDKRLYRKLEGGWYLYYFANH